MPLFANDTIRITGVTDRFFFFSEVIAMVVSDAEGIPHMGGTAI